MQVKVVAHDPDWRRDSSKQNLAREYPDNIESYIKEHEAKAIEWRRSQAEQ